MNEEDAVQETLHDEEKWILEAKRGGAEAKEWVAEKYSVLITKLSLRFNIGIQSKFLREELVQAGYIGLFCAMENYLPEKGAAFGTYAFPWILGEMRKALKSAVDHTGSYDGIRKIRRFQENFEAANGREPTITEISKGCAMPLWQTANLINRSFEAQPMDEAVVVAFNSDWQKGTHEIAEWEIALERLPVIERRLILLRYFRDLSQQETACALGKSQAQISRVERKAIERLKGMLTE